MFETGEYVVYGRTGICQVTGVTTMKMDGSSSERLYYVLRPGGETEGKIFTPVEGGKQVLRGIITKEEAEKATKNVSAPANAEIFSGSSRQSIFANRPDYLMAKKQPLQMNGI